MDGMLGIFQSFSSAKRENIPIFIKALNEHQCFQQASSGRNEFISHLSGLLSSPNTRFDGLLILEELLQQCSLDILEQKGSVWGGLCIKTCSQKNMFASVPMACRSLCILIEKSLDIPELSKAFTGHLLGNFFDSLKHSPNSGRFDVLRCVETALRLYPAACGPHRGAIEKFVGQFIDCADRDVVRAAAKCIHLLQQIRGGNTVGISYQESWRKLQIGLIGSLHETLNNIFSDCTELYDHNENSDKISITILELDDDPIRRATQLVNRFKNLIDYLIVALTEPFPVSKPIMPRKILNLIQRGLAINCLILRKSPTSNNLAVGALLPEIHMELYNLLIALILTLKSNMALYVHTFLSCILETLKWTSSGKSTGFTKPYSGLRIAAYKSLYLWNQIMKHGSCCELIADYLVEQIKYDIIPFQNEVTLQVLSGGKKHMSKKARRLLHKAQNEQSNISQTHSKAFNPQNTKVMYSDRGNQELCAAALNCLKSVVASATTFLKPLVVKDILDTIFSIAFLVVNSGENVKTQLYSSDACRLNLYEVLYAIVCDPHHLCPPPIQLLIDVFAVAQAKDRNSLVRSACSQFLKTIEKIVHPQKESIYYPIDKNDIKNALRNKSNWKASERDNENLDESEPEMDVQMQEEETFKPPIEAESMENIIVSDADDDEILATIDLTGKTDDIGVLPDQRAENCHSSNSDEVIENISLASSENSVDVISENICIPSDHVDQQDQSEAEIAKSDTAGDKNDEPDAKKRRTGSDLDEDNLNDNVVNVETEKAMDGENPDDLVMGFLADFVDEIKEVL